MNKSYPKALVGMICLLTVLSCQPPSEKDASASNYVSLVENDSLRRLDVFIDNKFFTSYLYADSILRKPVLFPLFTASEERITRGYPFDPNPGERFDHPHHYGLWFNHGDVNGIDFWNSSVERTNSKGRYGRINHIEFLKRESGDTGILVVKKEWRSETDELILRERTEYIFGGDDKSRTITHTSTLMAPQVDVLFKDSKEGMFAMRVRRELEIPSDEPTKLIGSDLLPSDSATVDRRNVTGHYRNSAGLEGYPDVWGKRAKWMKLSGKVDNDSISVIIFDHPNNVNHPPHWMARDYGLYGVNSLGSNLYTEGKEQFNFLLKKGDSVTFKHQVLIVNGSPAPAEIETLYRGFAEGKGDQ